MGSPEGMLQKGKGQKGAAYRKTDDEILEEALAKVRRVGLGLGLGWGQDLGFGVRTCSCVNSF